MPNEVLDTLNALLEGLDLDPYRKVHAAAARSLAIKLDQARNTTSGAVAQAVPATARELRLTVAYLVDDQADREEFVAHLFDGPARFEESA